MLGILPNMFAFRTDLVFVLNRPTFLQDEQNTIYLSGELLIQGAEQR